MALKQAHAFAPPAIKDIERGRPSDKVDCSPRASFGPLTRSGSPSSWARETPQVTCDEFGDRPIMRGQSYIARDPHPLAWTNGTTLTSFGSSLARIETAARWPRRILNSKNDDSKIDDREAAVKEGVDTAKDGVEKHEATLKSEDECAKADVANEEQFEAKSERLMRMCRTMKDDSVDDAKALSLSMTMPSLRRNG